MLLYLQMIETPEDKKKFEQIYAEYKSLMFYVANQILHHEQDAEDAVHLAFIKIAENMDKIAEPICPKTKGYVVTIVENKSIDLVRSRARHPQEELDDSVAGLSVSYDGDNLLAQCILGLPPRYRQIILLKYSHGYNLHEIARMLDITEANAIKLDQRAKKRLHELCKEKEVL